MINVEHWRTHFDLTENYPERQNNMVNLKTH